MKRNFTILFILIGFNGFSQNSDALKTLTKKIYKANYLLDFETIVSFSHPEMAKTIGKDLLLEKIENITKTMSIVCENSRKFYTFNMEQ
jgi:hypothetical protein